MVLGRSGQTNRRVCFARWPRRSPSGGSRGGGKRKTRPPSVAEQQGKKARGKFCARINIADLPADEADEAGEARWSTASSSQNTEKHGLCSTAAGSGSRHIQAPLTGLALREQRARGTRDPLEPGADVVQSNTVRHERALW